MKNVLLITLLCPTMSFALDPASQEALDNTKEAMTNTQQRDAIIKESPTLKTMDSKVETLTGNAQNKEQIYSISSKVFENITNKSNGDPEAMKIMLENAQKNPEAFFKEHFTEDMQKAVRDLANDIEKVNPPKPTTPEKK